MVALIILALAGLRPAAVASEKPIVVSAKRDNYGSIEQHAVVFHKDKMVVTRNSNFFCGPSKRVLLGAFKASHNDERDTARAQAEQMFLRLKQDVPNLPSSASPHATRLYIGTREVTDSKAYASATRHILDLLCEATGLTAEDAVEVQLKDNKKLAFTKLSGRNKGQTKNRTLEEAGCKKRGSTDGSPVFECAVEGYGTALITGS